MKCSLSLALMLVSASLAGGCSLPATAALVAGGSAMNYTARETEVVYPATVLELDRAVEAVCTKLEVQRVSLAQRSNKGAYRGLVEDGRELELAYEVLAERTVRVGVRCGWVGDEEVAMQVHDALRLELESIWLNQGTGGPGLH